MHLSMYQNLNLNIVKTTKVCTSVYSYSQHMYPNILQSASVGALALGGLTRAWRQLKELALSAVATLAIAGQQAQGAVAKI